MISGMHAASHLPGRPTDVDDAPAPKVNQKPDDDDRQTEGQTEKPADQIQFYESIESSPFFLKNFSVI